MKKTTEPSLTELKKEIEILKVKKKRKLQLSTSTTERNKLMQDIKYLDNSRKSPSALAKIGRGLKISGKTLMEGLTTASRNLDRNAPEFKEFSKNMNPQEDLEKMFLN